MAHQPDLPGLIFDLNTRCPRCKDHLTPDEMGAAATPNCSKCGYNFSRKGPQVLDDRMPSKVYLVFLKEPCDAIQRVTADRFELEDKHLIFVTADGRLAALFLLEIVESFSVMPISELG